MTSEEYRFAEGHYDTVVRTLRQIGARDITSDPDSGRDYCVGEVCVFVKRDSNLLIIAGNDGKRRAAIKSMFQERYVDLEDASRASERGLSD